MALETFPDCIAPDVVAGPMFFTDVVVLQSGHESRNANWSQAQWKGTISVPAREFEKSQMLLAFFRAVAAGMANKFRIRDWSDYTASGSEGIFAIIDGTHLQAYKRYSSGSATHERKITRLRASPTITLTGGTGTWDYDTGILTVTSGSVTGWAGQFDVPARFDTDHMQWHIIDRNTRGPIIQWESVPVIEVRE